MIELDLSDMTQYIVIWKLLNSAWSILCEVLKIALYIYANWRMVHLVIIIIGGPRHQIIMIPIIDQSFEMKKYFVYLDMGFINKFMSTKSINQKFSIKLKHHSYHYFTVWKDLQNMVNFQINILFYVKKLFLG